MFWKRWWWGLASWCGRWLPGGRSLWCSRLGWLHFHRRRAELCYLAPDKGGGLVGLVPLLFAVVTARESGSAMGVVAERAHPGDGHCIAAACAIVHQGWLAMLPDQGRRSVVGRTTASFAATAKPFARVFAARVALSPALASGWHQGPACCSCLALQLAQLRRGVWKLLLCALCLGGTPVVATPALATRSSSRL